MGRALQQKTLQGLAQFKKKIKWLDVFECPNNVFFF